YSGNSGFQGFDNLRGGIVNNSRKAVPRVSFRNRHCISAEEGINKFLFYKWLEVGHFFTDTNIFHR
ncbi:MAG TPA: hypothetical protein DF409_00060, partial [Bacteroidales bacterium]|nr:hypothetical protein [Bacteroidales bacterium]